MIKTSPQEAAADFYRSPYELGRLVWGVFAALASFFLIVYLGVVLLAALQIFAITRSTARLTKGTRRVEAGDLDTRIAVKRHDQLGDLAVSFNRMTGSVKGMLAMVKSAVATLVHEGHRGVELLERLNRFMLKQPREHRMLTLAIADVDLAAGVAEITNAAHPPVFLSRGTVREVILPALPVGFAWRRPPPSERLDIEPGSRLVFYSDGLVEAVDGNEEQFGYERLKELLAAHAEESSEQLMATLLSALERHTGGGDLDDDLTVVIIDCGTPETPEPGSG